MFEQVEVNSERWLDLKDLKNEVWKPLIVLKKGIVYDYNNLYEASNYGRIKSLGIYHGKTNNFFNKPHILKSKNNNDGYLMYTLANHGKINYVTAHRIIASTFLNKNNNKTQVNHKDGNKYNNRIDNLEWCTPSENVKHAFDNGLKIAKVVGMPKEKNPNAKYTQKQIDDIRNKRKKGYTLKKLAIEYNTFESYICRICKNEFWK